MKCADFPQYRFTFSWERGPQGEAVDTSKKHADNGKDCQTRPTPYAIYRPCSIERDAEPIFTLCFLGYDRGNYTTTSVNRLSNVAGLAHPQDGNDSVDDYIRKSHHLELCLWLTDTPAFQISKNKPHCLANSDEFPQPIVLGLVENLPYCRGSRQPALGRGMWRQ